MLGIVRLDTRPDGLAALERAKARLDALDWYPRPVRTARVRMYVAPGFFRLPFMRRFHGYAAWNLILVRREPVPDRLVVHELCHVWQMQHHPLRMPLTYLHTPYRTNPWEVQARRAAGEPAR
jgi:hypothetical protein